MDDTPLALVRYCRHGLKLIRHQLLWLAYFIRYAVRQFYRQRGLQIASSLTYTTLLAMVPLVTVAFGFLGGLPVFAGMSNGIQDFMFRNFVPSFGATVQEHLQEFSVKASNLTGTGIIILVVIALMLMATIDNALNQIWRVRGRRNPAARFLVYWTILTLGPLLVGAGLVSSSFLLSSRFLSDTGMGHGLRPLLLSWLPFLTTAVAFTLMYILVPNCFVLRRHALVGGIMSAVLFQGAYYGFGVYISRVPTYQAIYSAFAVVPLFLIWLYISWVIVLLGAHVTFCLSAFRLERERAGRVDAEWTFYDACRIVRRLWQAQQSGRPLTVPQLRRQGSRLPHYQLLEIMEALKSANWVHSQSGGSWILARDMAAVTLMDLYRIFPSRIALDSPEYRDSDDIERLRELLADYNGKLVELMEVPLGSVLR